MPDDAKPLDAFIPGHINVDTLSGDLRDILLGHFRAARKPWQQMSEAEQSDFNEGVAKACRQLVRNAVSALVAVEHPKCVVHLGDVKIIGGDKSRIEAKIVAQNISEYREILCEAVGDTVLMLMINSENFMGERAPAPTVPDQAALPIDGETEGFAAPDDEPDEAEDDSTPADDDVPPDDGDDDGAAIPLAPADAEPVGA
jgi:hypothetical protein